MMQIETTPESNIIYTTSTGTLTKEDYDRLIPVLNDKLSQHDKIRWYFEMKDFTGWKPDAFWQDMKFDFKHASDFEKVAMVGEKIWQDWMTQAMKPFTSAEIKYFDLKDEHTAKAWIKA